MVGEEELSVKIDKIKDRNFWEKVLIVFAEQGLLEIEIITKSGDKIRKRPHFFELEGNPSYRKTRHTGIFVLEAKFPKKIDEVKEAVIFIKDIEIKRAPIKKVSLMRDHNCNVIVSWRVRTRKDY